MTKVIAFTGLDGTGKSTQVRMLASVLEERGVRVISVHHFAPMIPLVRWLKRRMRRLLGRMQRSTVVPGTAIVSRPSTDQRACVNRSSDHSHALVPTLSRRLLGLHWTVTGYLKAASLRLRTRGADVVISDRCFIDDLVRVRWKCTTAPPASDLLLRLQRPPDLVFSLDVEDSGEAWHRKKERNTTAAAFETKQDLHRSVISALPSRWPVEVVNVTGRTAPQVHHGILEVVL